MIEGNGPMPFPEFMTHALYDPERGYYAKGTRQVGRGGDFFTSVSVGPLFGILLAYRFIREWKELGSPEKWRIIECGAHDGTLAKDILSEIRAKHSGAFEALEYVIPEPLQRLQEAQRKTLADFPNTARFIQEINELHAHPLPGVAFGNELLDALPFQIVTWTDGEWHEVGVSLDAAGTFVWVNKSLLPESILSEALAAVAGDFSEGYRTEFRTNYAEFLAPLTQALSRGTLLWIDYGFARPEYYHPDRTTGTLRTFSKHRAAEDPLATPGELDITAHVDFTAVAESAIAIGCTPALFRNQGAWLTEIARDWLLSMEGSPDAGGLRQFQTLTHPGHLGRSFHVIELAWNRPEKIAPARDIHQLAMRACPSQPPR